MEMQVYSSTPQIGQRAPDFTAITTFGEMKLSDYKGKWIVLFSHPADFTPVIKMQKRILYYQKVVYSKVFL